MATLEQLVYDALMASGVATTREVCVALNTLDTQSVRKALFRLARRGVVVAHGIGRRHGRGTLHRWCVAAARPVDRRVVRDVQH